MIAPGQSPVKKMVTSGLMHEATVQYLSAVKGPS